MEFRVLGQVEALSGGHPLHIGGEQQRALLAYLLLHANEVVSADRLLDELWAVPPRGGVAAVRTQVSRLRKQLGGDAIETSGRGYVLHVRQDELDLDRFRALLAQAGATPEPGRRSALLREADTLWHGEALVGLDAPFATVEAAALAELRLAALEDRLEADLERGLNGELISELSALVARYPLRERLRFQLILALYRGGRQADALEAYHDTRRMLDEELGLEPSPSLRELERAILRHDPALSVARPAKAAVTESSQVARRRPARIMLAGVALAAIGVAGGATVLLTLGRPAGESTGTVAAQAGAQRPARARAAAVPRVRRRPHTAVPHRPKPAVAATPSAKTRATTPMVETPATAPAKPATTVASAANQKSQPVVAKTRQSAPPKEVTVSDAFDGDYVDPTIWHQVENGGDVAITEQGGRLQLTVGANAVPGGTYNQIDVHVGTQCAFPGNFDARVDYTLLEWPAGDNIDIGLNAIYANAAVMRESSSQWGDQYGSWVIPSNGSVALPDTSGSLRIARVNGVETTYFLHEGTWRKLASSPAAGAAVFGLQAMSDGQHSFGGQEVKVAFDNFTVNGTNPTCAPGSQPN
jgi:DNA-binding SARP family transcriptional activator